MSTKTLKEIAMEADEKSKSGSRNLMEMLCENQIHQINEIKELKQLLSDVQDQLRQIMTIQYYGNSSKVTQTEQTHWVPNL